MARSFGIVTSLSGLSAGLVVNDLSFSQNADVAEARTSDGKISDLHAYSCATTITLSGVLDSESGSLVTAGSTLTIDSKTYIIESVTKTESNQAFCTVQITARTADSATVSGITTTGSGT